MIDNINPKIVEEPHPPRYDYRQLAEKKFYPIIICTIFSINYTARAQVLINTIRQLHPQVYFIALIVDEPNLTFIKQKESYDFVWAKDLNIPNWSHTAFKYTQLELNALLKPYFIEYLFDRFHALKIIYLDPDGKLYHPLNSALSALDDYTLLLTPHITKPYKKSWKEFNYYQFGIYNTGFLAISRLHQWREILRWWQDKLYHNCLTDVPFAYGDQKAMDLAPVTFPYVRIFKNPGYNLAWWNANQRYLSMQDGLYFVNRQPLVFYHLSRFQPENKDKLEQVGYLHLDEAYKTCIAEYTHELIDMGYYQWIQHTYSYSTYNDGTPLTLNERRLLRAVDPIAKIWQNPFSVEDVNSFKQYAQQYFEQPLR